MLFGAIAQVGLFVLLPSPYAFVPSAVLALNVLTTTIVQVSSSRSNAYDSDIIPGRVSAQLPNKESGRFGSQPAASPIVVFHLGVRFNHPLGLLAPGAREVADYFK